jgi:hypothetical protein
MELQHWTPALLKNPQKSRKSANEITRISNYTDQKRGCEEFSSGSSVNPLGARHWGEIYVFTYVLGTTAVYKQGTSEVQFTPLRYIKYEYGTPAVYSASPLWLFAVQLLLYFCITAREAHKMLSTSHLLVWPIVNACVPNWLTILVTLSL